MAAQHDDARPQTTQGDQPAPTLSVTVLNYNYGKYLPQCLDSILRQTWTDFELILINDCSTDNSLEVIQPYLADPRVKLVDHPQNKGYIASLIEGSELSRGKYITVISADDYCVSDCAFATLVQMLEIDEQIVFAYSAHGNYGNDGARVWLVRPRDESGVRTGVQEYRDLILENYILHSGVIIRANTYRTVGGYDASVRYACDTLMWLMLCGQGKVAYSTDELYAYRLHGSNMSDSTGGIRIGLWEHLNAIERTFADMRKSPEIRYGLYARAMKQIIRTTILSKLFSGHPKLAWYAFWCSVRLHPVFTIFQRSTLILIGYTLLGPARFNVWRHFLSRRRSAMPADDPSYGVLRPEQPEAV